MPYTANAVALAQLVEKSGGWLGLEAGLNPTHGSSIYSHLCEDNLPHTTSPEHTHYLASIYGPVLYNGKCLL